MLDGQQPSADGFDQFMAERWPRVLRSAFLLTGDQHDAEDLAQAAFERACAAIDSNMCAESGVYQNQVPVTPAPNEAYEFSASGKEPNELFEAIYTFAPGTGPSVMQRVRVALDVSCQHQGLIKREFVPSVADEAIAFTVGGTSRNILVRSGDRVASMVVDRIPAGPDGMAWIDDVARQMAMRLTGG